MKVIVIQCDVKLLDMKRVAHSGSDCRHSLLHIERGTLNTVV
jgi:hypothetical protein